MHKYRERNHFNFSKMYKHNVIKPLKGIFEWKINKIFSFKIVTERPQLKSLYFWYIFYAVIEFYRHKDLWIWAPVGGDTQWSSCMCVH